MPVGAEYRLPAAATRELIARDYQDILRLGYNTVVLVVRWLDSEPERGQYRFDALDSRARAGAIDRAARRAAARGGRAAALGLHPLSRRPVRCPPGPAAATSSAAVSTILTFAAMRWRSSPQRPAASPARAACWPSTSPATWRRSSASARTRCGASRCGRSRRPRAIAPPTCARRRETISGNWLKRRRMSDTDPSSATRGSRRSSRASATRPGRTTGRWRRPSTPMAGRGRVSLCVTAPASCVCRAGERDARQRVVASISAARPRRIGTPGRLERSRARRERHRRSRMAAGAGVCPPHCPQSRAVPAAAASPVAGRDPSRSARQRSAGPRAGAASAAVPEHSRRRDLVRRARRGHGRALSPLRPRRAWRLTPRASDISGRRKPPSSTRRAGR